MHKASVGSFFCCVVLACASCLAPETGEGITNEQLAEVQSKVVAGTVEPDYKHPWVVDFGHCHGVLIDPQWILTAAHCVVSETTSIITIRVSRTDPATGQVRVQDRTTYVLPPYRDAYIKVHPDYYDTGFFAYNDIALVRLATPFVIDQYVQTAALPSAPRVAGRIGTVASYVSHTGTLAPGTTAIMRAEVPAGGFPESIDISSATSGLCPGDSGSGFITLEGGRATVTGIASSSVYDDCDETGLQAQLMDVYYYRDWILSNIAATNTNVDGNTRVRWSGRSARGVIGLGCNNPFGTLWGPLNVQGVRLGANCPWGETQSAICSLDANQSLPLVITGFKMRTVNRYGSVSTTSLPFSASWASYYGTPPKGTIQREFTCEVGLANTGGGGGFF